MVNTARPGDSGARTGHSHPGGYDPRERLTATRLTRRNPHWLIIWGTYSRVYWAYPLFSAPQGTIMSAVGPAALAAGMRDAEAAMAARPGVRPA